MDIEDIARAAQLASALEVSGYPKPGNVHRTADFKETTFERFIASSIAIGSSIMINENDMKEYSRNQNAGF